MRRCYVGHIKRRVLTHQNHINIVLQVQTDRRAKYAGFTGNTLNFDGSRLRINPPFKTA